MRWNVEGSDMLDGRQRVVTVEAKTEEAACAVGRDEGLNVRGAYPSILVAPAEALDRMVEQASQGELPVLTRAAEPLTYSPRPGVADVAPNYSGLLAVSKVLAVFAVLLYAASAVTTVTMIGLWGDAAPVVLYALLFGLLFAAVGAICHGLAHMCTAVRDAARNSFKRRA